MRKTLVFIASDNKLNCCSNNPHQTIQQCDPVKGNSTEIVNCEIIKNNKILESLEGILDENGGFTPEDFLVWSVENHSLIAPLLELLFQVCHVSLGLRPHCRHEEYEIGNLEILFNYFY